MIISKQWNVGAGESGHYCARNVGTECGDLIIMMDCWGLEEWSIISSRDVGNLEIGAY